MEPDLDIEKVAILGKESILVGHGLWEGYIINDLLQNVPSSTYVLVTDDHLYPLYVRSFEHEFTRIVSNKGCESRLLVHRIAPGESSKSRDVKAQIEDWMLSEQRNPPCDTKTVIIALGGGVIGDLLGFVASTFKRGIRFVQVPTSLLAMVDSSIGGKTAIDTSAGKNLIGSFWQPTRIYVDLQFLNTLPTRQFINGMAEVIKTAAIWDEEAFAFLEAHASTIVSAINSPTRNGRRDISEIKKIVKHAILGSIKVKAEVVTSDEREGGLRNLLNFGHSIGHAYEAILAPQILHGECVAIGMRLEALLARYLGVLDDSAVARLTKCLVSYGLPITVDDKNVNDRSSGRKCPVQRLLTIMAVDKKNEGSKKKIVLLSAIGKTHERRATPVDDKDIRLVLSAGVQITSQVKPRAVVSCTPPGSKSISNRALVLAALSKGTCRLTNLLHSDDTEVMMNALTELKAASFAWEDNGRTLAVTGNGGAMQASSNDLYLGNAGTASRFLTSVVTLAVPGQASHSILTGNPRMKQRPIGPLVEALRLNGAHIEYVRENGGRGYSVKTTSEQQEKYGRCLPLQIDASGGMEGGEIQLDAMESSQYVSSILMCAPRAKKPVTLRMVGGPPISQPYIDMTTAMMAAFGVNVTKSKTEEHTYHIPQAVYQSPESYVIESDASSATYPLALAAISGTSCTVPNIGSNSLQGDAQFAVKVLGPMGCKVEQTASSTSVTGPPLGALRPIPEIDMTTMTDAFLTASILAAVAQNKGSSHTTRITGIANQQKKECERIAAVRDQLTKFGVSSRLWPDNANPDGIEVDGVPISQLKEPHGGVHCYDDHRVAMSFSVLAVGSRHGGLIKEKTCVGKTWPGWWDALKNDFDIRLEGRDVSLNQAGKHQIRSQSIFLVGMRGAGKTTVGKWASSALGWPFTDLDELLEKNHKDDIPGLIQKHGWDGFRERELAVIKTAIAGAFKTPQVFACGGGIVETAEARQLLINYRKAGGIVILVERNMEDVLSFLQKDKSRPAYVEDMRNVWQRRAPWYQLCSNYQYFSRRNQDHSGGQIPADFRRFLKTIQSENRRASDLLQKRQSFFLSLTVPDLRSPPPNLSKALDDVDAIELRVDLLQDPSDPEKRPSIEFVAEQLALCRGMTSLPIIFTVRTTKEGGKYSVSNLEQEEDLLRLLELGLKSAVEFLDVEIQSSQRVLEYVRQNKKWTKIIASRHDTNGSLSWSRDWSFQFERASQIGDVVKLVGVAKSYEENLELENFRLWAAKESEIPMIAINMGSRGQISRILNSRLTPVCHPSLLSKAAPGQLSTKEIRTGLGLHGVIPSLDFYIFGKPITSSPSPNLHNAFFRAWGFPYKYDRFESDDPASLVDILSASTFGGASVTIPLKVDIIQLLDAVSPDVQVIGAVNTVVVDRTRNSNKQDGHYLIGHNTDWKGIESVLTLAGATKTGGSAMVIGTGGTSRAAIYALHQMNYSPIYLVGRCEKKADALAASFDQDYNIKPLCTSEACEKIKLPDVAVGTIPASADIESGMAATLRKVLSMCAANGLSTVPVPPISRVFLEMAYLPDPTPLTGVFQQAQWKCVPGKEVLASQGCFQAELWTGYLPSFEEAKCVVAGVRQS